MFYFLGGGREQRKTADCLDTRDPTAIILVAVISLLSIWRRFRKKPPALPKTKPFLPEITSVWSYTLTSIMWLNGTLIVFVLPPSETISNVYYPPVCLCHFQLIDFLDVIDDPILGYTAPAVITVLHTHLASCAVDYRYGPEERLLNLK